tara:strand:- start:4665 stop:5399 length:735 start_codon:yes stop_codon:yes gene_type:complete
MGKELVKEADKEVVPSYLKDIGGDGAEDIQSDMITSSYIKLIQKTSKEFDEGTAKLGEFVDSVTSESYGVKFDVIVIKMSTTWKKFDDNNKFIGQSENGLTWDDADNTPLTKEEKWKSCFFEFYVIPLRNFRGGDIPIPNIVTFSGASFKGGKHLHNIISRFVQMKSEPIYARNYCFYSEEKQGEKGKYVELKTKVNDGFNLEEVVMACSKARKMIKDIVFNNSEVSQTNDFCPSTGGEVADLD